MSQIAEQSGSKCLISFVTIVASGTVLDVNNRASFGVQVRVNSRVGRADHVHFDPYFGLVWGIASPVAN